MICASFLCLHSVQITTLWMIMLASPRWTPKRRAQPWPTASTTWLRKVRGRKLIKEIQTLNGSGFCYFPWRWFNLKALLNSLHLFSFCPLLLLLLLFMCFKNVRALGMTTTNRHGNHPFPPRYSLSSALALFSVFIAGSAQMCLWIHHHHSICVAFLRGHKSLIYACDNCVLWSGV